MIFNSFLLTSRVPGLLACATLPCLTGFYTTFSVAWAEILRHSGFTFGMGNMHIGYLRKANQRPLICLLQNYALEAQIWFKVLTSFLHQIPTGELVIQRFSRLLTGHLHGVPRSCQWLFLGGWGGDQASLCSFGCPSTHL